MMNVGQWVRRQGQGKWHVIASTADAEPVTRCGRRLRQRADSRFQSSEVVPLTRMIGQPQLCRTCK